MTFPEHRAIRCKQIAYKRAENDRKLVFMTFPERRAIRCKQIALWQVVPDGDVGIVAGSNSPVMTLSVFVFFLFWSMAATSSHFFYHSI